jgi:hypothetical protein
MAVYWASILGVLRRAIVGARYDWKGRGMRSWSWKSRERKLWTSGICDRASRKGNELVYLRVYSKVVLCSQ